MIKEYLYRVVKVAYISVPAACKEEAEDRLDDYCEVESNEEIASIELVDVYDEDVDAIYDELKLRKDELYD